MGFTYDWDTAKQYCIDNYGTDLASITNTQRSSEATNLLTTYGNLNAWIGGKTETPPTTGWYWSDGSPWIEGDTIWWTASEPNEVTIPDCTIYWSAHLGYWGDYPCVNPTSAFFCNIC